MARRLARRPFRLAGCRTWSWSGAGRQRRGIGRREQSQFDLEPQAAHTAPFRVDLGKPPSNAGESGDTSRVATGTQAAGQIGPDRLDHLVEDDTDIATAVLELVENTDPGNDVAVHERCHETFDGLGFCEAQEVADGGFVDPATG